MSGSYVGSVWSCIVRDLQLQGDLSSGWSMHQGIYGKLTNIFHTFNIAFLPSFRSKQVFIHSSWAESRLPTALLLVQVVLQPATGVCFPCVWLQDWGTQCVTWVTHSLGQISMHVLSLLLWVLSKDTGPGLISFIPLLLNSVRDFSYSLVCTGVCLPACS